MASEYVPNEHHIVRHVSYARQERHPDTDVLLGIRADAFRRRETEDYLSVSWLEHFSGSKEDQLSSVAAAMAADGMKIVASTCLALAEVATFKRVCERFGSKVRIVHEETEKNPSHAAVRRLPRDNNDLLELLATEAVCDFCLAVGGTWSSQS